MARAVALIAAIALAGCASREPAPVRHSVAVCPETPPALLCPALPAGDAPISLADVFALLGDCRATVDAWAKSHESCRRRMEAVE